MPFPRATDWESLGWRDIGPLYSQVSQISVVGFQGGGILTFLCMCPRNSMGGGREKGAMPYPLLSTDFFPAKGSLDTRAWGGGVCALNSLGP